MKIAQILCLAFLLKTIIADGVDMNNLVEDFSCIVQSGYTYAIVRVRKIPLCHSKFCSVFAQLEKLTATVLQM
jgi:hypothetical protein